MIENFRMCAKCVMSTSLTDSDTHTHTHAKQAKVRSNIVQSSIVRKVKLLPSEHFIKSQIG